MFFLISIPQIINGNNLKILGLVASDFGIYQCIGSNPAGNVQAAASLTILPSGIVYSLHVRLVFVKKTARF